MLDVLLAPLAALYGGVLTLRNWAYDRGLLPMYRAALPVISVGNLTAGGNAKTPLVMLLVGELKRRGYRPVVLTRGYAGRVRATRIVAAEDDAHEVGDEPLLISRCCGVPVVVSPDRCAGARRIEQQKLGDVIVLDDGFQHRRLARDLDLVAVNCTLPEDGEAFRRGRLLPWGRFRERRRPALERAHALVAVSRSASAAKGLPAVRSVLPPSPPLFEARLAAHLPSSVDDYFAGRSDEPLSPCTAVAFCAIASPAGFFLTLEGLGFQLTARRAYADHHPLSAEELASLRAAASGAPLICTAKDAVKLTAGERAGVYVLPMALVVEGQGTLLSLVEAAIRRRRASTAEHP